MEKGAEYKITKLEKGPLQRFKNQNLLIKKFGEVGITVYKAITGKRTTRELQKDLEMEQEILDEIISYMEEAGMIQLAQTGEEPAKKKGPKTEEMKEDAVAPEEKEERTSEEENPAEEEKTTEEEIQPAEEEKEVKREEEEAAPVEDEEIRPIEEETPKEKETEFEIPKEERREDDEIRPIEERESAAAPEEETETREEEEIKPERKSEREEPEPAEEESTEKEGIPREEKSDGEISTEELSIREEGTSSEEEGLSPVEKIIKDKYGDVGIKVYTLIDGQRTAEEIMKETGLSESKLVEMLDFMDEEGIIKLEYPGEKKKAQSKIEKSVEREGFTPIVEEEEMLDKEIGKNPVEVPIKTPLNAVEALYLRTKTLLKFGERGGKALESINGKNDVIDISLENLIPLYEMNDLLNFLLEQRRIMLKPLTRAEIRKKYGDDGYAIYKKYGKDGVFFYELVGKDMKIKDMVKLVYKDVEANKEKIADMFLFIHQILKIDLPIDKDLLYREFRGS